MYEEEKERRGKLFSVLEIPLMEIDERKIQFLRELKGNIIIYYYSTLFINFLVINICGFKNT